MGAYSGNPIGHWEIAADTGDLYWSDEVYRIHGQEPGGEIDLEAAINVYHPDDRDMVAEYVRRALEEKEDFHFDLRIINSDADVVHVRSTGVVRLTEGETVRSVFGTFQDISDTYRQREELSRQTEMLRQAESIAQFGHWEVNAKTGALYWSDEIYRIHGMEVGAEIDIDAAIAVYHPDDRDKVAEYVRRALEEKEDYEFVLRITRKDGEVRHVKSTGLVHLDEKGAIDSVFGVFQDITELHDAQEQLRAAHDDLEIKVEERTRELQKEIAERETAEKVLQESEERFRTFFQMSPDAFMITRVKDGLCVDVNDGFTRLSGFTRDEVVGKPTVEIGLWENENDRKRLVESISQDGYLMSLSANFKRKDGSTWPGMMSGYVITIDKEQHILTSTKDVSDLQSALLQAEQASRAKSDFLASMSHELRTPLNAILGFAQLLQVDPEKTLSDKQKTSISHIVKSGDHLMNLISQILELAKIEGGELNLTIESCPPSLVIENCVIAVTPLAVKRDIEITDNTSDHGLPGVLADTTAFNQVLLNLLSNAVKYNSEGGTIVIDSNVTPENMLRLSVRDTGKGIPDNQKGKVFQPFDRLGREALEIEGAGIGLTICQRLMEAMDGRIDFQSEIGKGSEFWIDFPIDGSATNSTADNLSEGNLELK